MKNLRKFCAAVVLTLAIAVPTFSGEISCPGLMSEPPPPQQQGCVTGEISCPGATSEGEPDAISVGNPGAPAAADLDPVTEIILTLFQSLLSFF